MPSNVSIWSPEMPTPDEFVKKVDLAGTADGKGAAMVGFIQAGAVSRTVQDKLREVASVDDFGAVGDGVTDDAPAFTAALASRDAIFLPPNKSYFLGTAVAITSNKRVYGVSGASEIIVGSNAAFYLSGIKVENVVLAGFNISSSADVGNTSQGIINCDGPETDGILLEDIVFEHPDHGRNSIFFKSRPTAEVNNVTMRRIKVKSSGRMGIEIIQHEDGDAAYGRKITIEDCDISNTGGKANGMGISISGGLGDIRILNNRMQDNPYSHIELAGKQFNCEIAYNEFSGDSTYHIISSNTPGGSGYWFHHNKSVPGCTGYWRLSACSGALVEENFMVGNNVYLYIVTHSITVRRNTIITKSGRCVFVDGQPNNDIYENLLDNSQATANFSVLSLYNVGAVNNRVFDNTYLKGPGGTALIEENGASNNLFRNNTQARHPIQRDLVFVPSGNTRTISFIQNFRGENIPISSWYPMIFEITVAGCAPGNGSLCAARAVLCVIYLKNGTPGAINSDEMVIFDKNINLSVSFSLNTITISTSPPAGAVLRWEIKLPQGISDQFISVT